MVGPWQAEPKEPSMCFVRELLLLQLQSKNLAGKPLHSCLLKQTVPWDLNSASGDIVVRRQHRLHGCIGG